MFPKLCDSIYQKKDGKELVLFNYELPNGVVLINNKALKILELCDGNNSIEVISKKLRIREDILEEFLKYLDSYNIISYEDKNINNKPDKVLHCWLHITNQCNLNCRYCYINKNNIDMDFDVAKEIIDKLIVSLKENNFNKIVLSFSGGEPLLRVDLIEKIIDYCNTFHNISFSYRILTNGILIGDRVIKLIKENNVDVRISLDGIKEYNDKNRCYYDKRGSYYDVVNGILYLKKNDIEPTINVVVTKENIDGLFELTKRLIDFNLPFRFSLEKSNNNIMPSIINVQSKIIRKLKSCLKLILKCYSKGIFDNSFNVDDISFNNSTCRNCGVGDNIIAIGSNGDVALCGMDLCRPISNIYKDNDLISIINDCEVSKFNINKVNECKSCIWKHVCNNGCPILNYNIFGDFNKKSSYCKIYREIIPLLYEIEIAKKRKNS
ncbi:MAG: radical SAM protein [Bacilli bacterium]